jgi:acyl-homoserine-lactone acylase
MTFPAKAFLCALMTTTIVLQSRVADAAPPRPAIEIQWTEHGIPHVKAPDYYNLGLGYGYAVAQDRLCSIANHYITLRGERSRWYGAEGQAMAGFVPTQNLNADLFFKVQLSDAVVRLSARGLQADTRALIRGYVAGINRYVSEIPASKRQGLCEGKPIPTVNEADILRAEMAIGVTKKAFHTALYAASSASAWQAKTADTNADADPAVQFALSTYNDLVKGQGSNAWAYGSDVAPNDRAIVVANPHSPWMPYHWHSFHIAHLTIPGKLDYAGAAFSGLPVPMIGFNENVAWGMTSAHSWFMLQVMSVQESGTRPTYVMDGKQKPLVIERVTVDVLEKDGTLSKRVFEVPFSELGPLYRLPALSSQGRPAGWYVVTAPSDNNARALDQFLAAGRARNVGELIKAIEDNRGRGVHIIAGDKYGDLGLVEAGPVLDLSDAQLADCRYPDPSAAFYVLDGSRRACSAQTHDGMPSLAPASRYPGPRTRGIIQSTNNSYEHSIYGRVMPQYPILFGDEDPFVPTSSAGISADRSRDRNMRIVMSTRRMGEISADGVVTPTEAMDVIFDNRNFVAEDWLDEILSVCAVPSPSPEASRGCAALAAWDRKNNSESRGALLFHQFWLKIARIGTVIPAKNPDDLTVRESLTITPENRASVLAALEDAVKEVEALGFAVDTPWGNAFHADTAHGRVPLHGGSMRQGVLNAMDVMPLTREGFPSVAAGAAYLHRVRWENGELVPDVLLSYGQKEDPQSGDRAAQIQLFADKKLFRMPFSEEALSKARIVRRISLTPERR